MQAGATHSLNSALRLQICGLIPPRSPILSYSPWMCWSPWHWNPRWHHYGRTVGVLRVLRVRIWWLDKSYHFRWIILVTLLLKVLQGPTSQLTQWCTRLSVFPPPQSHFPARTQLLYLLPNQTNLSHLFHSSEATHGTIDRQQPSVSSTHTALSGI